MDGWQKVVWVLVAAVVVLALAAHLLGGRNEPPRKVHSTSELLGASRELSRTVGSQIGEIRNEVRDSRSDCAEIRRLCGEIQRIAREGIESCGEN